MTICFTVDVYQVLPQFVLFDFTNLVQLMEIMLQIGAWTMCLIAYLSSVSVS